MVLSILSKHKEVLDSPIKPQFKIPLFFLGLATHISATCPVTGSKKERLKHPCCKCGKVFSGKHRLEAHFKSVHLNEKPTYQCVPCGKYFVDPHQLKVA